jgi:pentatricopeptide repeat protein
LSALDTGSTGVTKNNEFDPHAVSPSQAKTFLFSPTLDYQEFATKFKLIDTLADRIRPSWLGRALTYVAASWRDYAKEAQATEQAAWPDWMLPVRPETAYFVLDVLLHRSSKENAVKIAEDFAERYPHVNVYSQRLQVWSQSDLPTAPDKIEEILQEIERKRVRYTRRIYTVLLRHFKDDPARVEQLVQQINDSGMSPDTAMWAALASSYARNGRMDDALHIWKDRLWESPISNDGTNRHGTLLRLLREAASELMDGLRTRITADRQTTRASLRNAQSLVKSREINKIQIDGKFRCVIKKGRSLGTIQFVRYRSIDLHHDETLRASG